MTLLTHDRAADLRRLYPLWTIWQSDIGRWWAWHEGGISLAQRDLGVVATLDADDLDALAGLLAAQELIRAVAA